MAIRITAIEPNQDASLTGEQAIQAHRDIKKFRWIDELAGQTGTSSHSTMFDWIVNKKGRAFVKLEDGVLVNVYGTITASGQQYIRCLDKGEWTNQLLKLPSI
jgi:hypothetical protein